MQHLTQEHGTVVGEAQGPADKLAVLRTWLEKEGSPKSKIERAVFSHEVRLAAQVRCLLSRPVRHFV